MAVVNKGVVIKVGKLMDMVTLKRPARKVTVLVNDDEWLRIHHVETEV